MSKRTTLDMDTTIIDFPLVEEEIISLIKDIIQIQLDDGIEFEFIKLVSTREKDDLHLLKLTKENEIDFKLLGAAILNTAIRRNSDDLLELSEGIINLIEQSEIIKINWDRYKSKYDYASPISFEDIIQTIHWYQDKLNLL